MKLSSLVLSLSASIVVLAGCNLAPRYSAPKTDLPAQFREAGPASAPDGTVWAAAQPRDEQSRGKWWQAYGDPQLNALEEQVRVSNQTLKAAEANFRAARAAAALAHSSLFPLITANPSFTRSHASRNLESSTGTRPSANAPAAVNNYSMAFDASYELDVWGRVRNTATAATAEAEASGADLASATLSIQAELAQDYFQLRAIDAQSQILNDTVASFRASLDETRTLFHAGIDSEEDVARAETQLNSSVAQATDLGVTRSALEHAIAVLLGRAPANFTLPAESLRAVPPPVPVTLPADLLQQRPDIAAAERRVAAANAQIGIARSAYFPRITLTGTGGWQSSASGTLFEAPSRFWSVGPQLAQLLFNGGAIRAESEQARAQYDQAAANYREVVLSAFQAVEDNLAAARILEQESREQRVAVQSSQHLLDLANTRFKLGIDSYLNVITAQTALLANRQAEVQIQLRRMTASIALIKAVGGGWDSAQRPKS